MNYNTSDNTTQSSEIMLSNGNDLKPNTNLECNDLKTFEIDKTNNISNEEFLTAIFGDVKRLLMIIKKKYLLKIRQLLLLMY